jgi:putative ATPase
MGEREYYRPVERGLEITLKQKLDALREARRAARGEE